MRAIERRRRGLTVLAATALATTLVACGTAEVKLTPGKPPPDVRQEGDVISMRVGSAVILSAESDDDSRISLESGGIARIAPTTRERLFVLIAQRDGTDTVRVRLGDDVVRTFVVNVAP